MRIRAGILVILTLVAGCHVGRNAFELEPALQRDPIDLAQLQKSYEGNIYPFFDEYCFSCHGERKQELGVNLASAESVASIGEDEDTWRRVLAMIESGKMPPEKRRQPSEADRAEIAAFIESELDTSARAMRPDPGRVTARRLNREEYDNTVRDLLGVASNPARDFPVDDSGYGFDNIGDVLSLSPLQMEKYLTAAVKVADEAMKRDKALAPEDTTGKRHVLICGHSAGKHRASCAAAILREVATRAYRRPVTNDELRDLTRLAGMVTREGDPFEDGIQLALEAILVSPHFLFRIERDQRPNDPGALRFVNDFELASRLSYFLWSSMPDEELFGLARNGMLRNPSVLAAQVDRMIADEKAWECVSNFAGQWLQLRNLDEASRSDETYPTFDQDLRDAMRKESELFFNAVLREDRSILEFLDADFTFVNGVLAEHYGLAGIQGEEHQRIAVDGIQRGGVLTQASVLTLTAHPTRTSPVVRGAWILENILGTPPPPPPAEVPSLEEDPEKITGTMRQQLEAHRANAACATCHSRIDPLGFGLENYDPIGRWRTTEREFPVDSSGILPSGVKFQGSKELRRILIADPDHFVRNFTEKMLTYALGRGVESHDRPALAEIVSKTTADGYRFHTLVREIVASVPFRMRRGEGGPES